MKTKKLEDLKVMFTFYNNELDSLYEEQRKLNLDLIAEKEKNAILDSEGIKASFGATLPSSLGALAAILVPVSMAFTVPSFIIAGCVIALSAYLAVPNFIKWAKNLKQGDKSDAKIKSLESKITDNDKKIEMIKNKIDTISKLIDSYERNANGNKISKVQTTETNQTKNTNKISSNEKIR